MVRRGQLGGPTSLLSGALLPDPVVPFAKEKHNHAEILFSGDKTPELKQRSDFVCSNLQVSTATRVGSER